MRQCDPIGLAKAVLWEEAKGKLRALVMADGAQIGGVPDERGRYHYTILEDAVESFIKDFEEQGLHE